MAAEAAILDRDHRILHHLRDLGVRQPFAIARAQTDDRGAVIGQDADHLAVGRGFEFVETRQLRFGHIDGDDERNDAEQGGDAGKAQTQHEPAAPAGDNFGRLGHRYERGLRGLTEPRQAQVQAVRRANQSARGRKSRLIEFMQ
jgi:hypothetical protein